MGQRAGGPVPTRIFLGLQQDDHSLLTLSIRILESVDDIPDPATFIPSVVDQEQKADSIQIMEAQITGPNVKVFATSDRQYDDSCPGPNNLALFPILNVSIGGIASPETGPPAPMTWVCGNGRYEFIGPAVGFPAAPGDTVTVSSNEGGAYNVIMP